MKIIYYFTFFCLLLFTGCGPKYIIKSEYTPPPETKNSKLCLDNCQNKQIKCQENCQNNFQNCMLNAHDLAKKSEGQRIQNYQYQMQQYNIRYQEFSYRNMNYDREIQHLNSLSHMKDRECKKYGDKRSCMELSNIQKDLKHLKHKKPYPPVQPGYPDFNSLLLDQQEKCSILKDCGCENNYNQCFSSCGGKINFHQICVENCDK